MLLLSLLWWRTDATARSTGGDCWNHWFSAMWRFCRLARPAPKPCCARHVLGPRGGSSHVSSAGSSAPASLGLTFWLYWRPGRASASDAVRACHSDHPPSAPAGARSVHSWPISGAPAGESTSGPAKFCPPSNLAFQGCQCCGRLVPENPLPVFSCPANQDEAPDLTRSSGGQ